MTTDTYGALGNHAAKHYYKANKTEQIRLKSTINKAKKFSPGVHYKKVDGSAPGQKYGGTLSANEVGAVLCLTGSRLYEFLKAEPFQITWIDGHPRINKASFEEWYAARPSMDDTYSATEVAAMMGVHRNTVYDLIAKGLFKTERYNDRPRIDKESFAEWYWSQNRYYIPKFGKEA